LSSWEAMKNIRIVLTWHLTRRIPIQYWKVSW
jgi:hypothetical protein